MVRDQAEIRYSEFKSALIEKTKNVETREDFLAFLRYFAEGTRLSEEDYVQENGVAELLGSIGVNIRDHAHDVPQPAYLLEHGMRAFRLPEKATWNALAEAILCGWL